MLNYTERISYYITVNNRLDELDKRVHANIEHVVNNLFKRGLCWLNAA